MGKKDLLFSSTTKIESTSQSTIRQVYAISLDRMERAHLKAYFQMKENSNTSSDSQEIPLTRFFSSFDPCPLKLITIELCKEPLDLEQIPEIFICQKKEFLCLHKRYQSLDPSIKKQLTEDLLEGHSSEGLDFSQQLDSFTKKLIEATPANVSSLITVFQKDVYEAKELIDFLAKILRQEKKSTSHRTTSFLSIDLLLMHALSSYIKTGILPETKPCILKKSLPKLNEIRDKYTTLDTLSQLFLEQEFEIGRFGTKHEAKAEEILKELEKIISEIKLKNRNLMPLIVFLAHKSIT